MSSLSPVGCSAAAHQKDPQRQEPEHPHGDVGAVEADHHVEGRREQVRREPEPLVDEVAELVDLSDQEHAAEGRGRQEPAS